MTTQGVSDQFGPEHPSHAKRNRPEPASPAGWLCVGYAVVHSPRQSRDIELDWARVRQAIESPPDVQNLLRDRGLSWWISIARGVFGSTLRLRRRGAQIAGHSFPHSREVRPLLSRAVLELNDAEETVRVGLAGLSFLLIHPFEDGNGRSARFAWLKGLIQLGISPANAVAALDELYGVGGVAGLPTIQAASNGAIGPFIRRWSSVIDGNLG